jgi:hypothetical protein
MGRPPFHELQAAAFWVTDGKAAKLLNFSQPPSHLVSWVNANDVEPMAGGPSKDALERHLSLSFVLWPLMASSSIIVKHRKSPFKPEYLVPQMLLQWVTNYGDFDGVCYFSTNVRAASTRSPLPVCNFVFPAKEIKSSGRCRHLCDMFRMTEPHGWELLRAIQVGNGTCTAPTSTFDIEPIEGIEGQYQRSEFGVIEAKLNSLVLKIKSEGRVSAGYIRSDN